MKSPRFIPGQLVYVVLSRNDKNVVVSTTIEYAITSDTETEYHLTGWMGEYKSGRLFSSFGEAAEHADSL
jgi:pyruvoyl-dependent arginine decarboxylase (PvlArgDC)